MLPFETCHSTMPSTIALAADVKKPTQCFCLNRLPRLVSGLRRLNFGARFLPLATMPPGIAPAMTMASGTANNGSTMCTSSSSAAENTVDIAFSRSPASPSGTNTRRNR